jgi:O-acetylhomoserine (thiol)-lyase
LRPIDYGADIIVHSLTKVVAGMGQMSAVPSLTAAIFLGQNTLNVSACSIEPDASYHRLFCQRILGRRPTSKRCRSIYLRTTGSVLSPLIVFLLSGHRNRCASHRPARRNAPKVAEFRGGDAWVEWINYAGFGESDYYALGNQNVWAAGRAHL